MFNKKYEKIALFQAQCISLELSDRCTILHIDGLWGFPRGLNLPTDNLETCLHGLELGLGD